MTEEFTPTARWVQQPDGTWNPVRSTAASSTGSGSGEDALAPGDVLAGANVTVVDNGNGTITISATGSTGGLTPADIKAGANMTVVDNGDGTVTLSSTVPGEYLTQNEIIAGSNIAVVKNPDGTVTITGAPNEVVIQDDAPAAPSPGPTHFPALWLDSDEPGSSVVPPHAHPEYLEPPEILAGDNVTVTTLPNGSVIVAAAGGASGAGGTAHVAPEPPPNPVQGTLWVDVNDLQNPLLPASRLDAASWAFSGFGYAWGPGTVTDDVASGGVRVNWNENYTDGGPGAICATGLRDWEAGRTYLAWMKVRGETGAAQWRIGWPYTFSGSDGVPGQWVTPDGTDQETFVLWKPASTTNQRIGLETIDSKGGDHTVIDIQVWDITGLTLPMSVWTGNDWVYVSGIGITKDQADGFYVPLTHLSDENPHPQYLRASDLPTAGAVQSGATTSITNDVEVAVEFNTEQFDYGDMFDLATPTRFVCPSDGLYRASAQVGIASNTTGYRQLILKRNGAAIANVRQQALANNLSNALQIERMYPCAAGDYFEVAVRQNSGAALATVSGYSWTWMVVEKVR